jgi:hypothetical protein
MKLGEESAKKEKSGSIGDMSHYFGVTPLSIMKEDIDLFTPEQQAVIRYGTAWYSRSRT